MGYDAADVYYQPEEFGLTPIAEVECSDGMWQFDLIVGWKHKDGTVYIAQDSGCSCPSPFEDYNSLESLDKVASIESVRSLLDAASRGSYSELSQADARTFIKNVEAAL